MKPKDPKDLLYLTILSVIISGFIVGVAWCGVWLINNDRLWWAIFLWGCIIVWLMEVNTDE